MVGLSPLQTTKTHGDVDARIHIYTAMALGRGRVASPTRGHPYPRGKTPVLNFIGGLVDLRTSLDTKERRKPPPPPTPGIEPQAVQPVAQRLAS